MREKLIELLKDTRSNAAWHHWGYEESADHLIANGVTVQEWIPVTERKPTKEDAKVINGYIIAIMKGKKPNLWKWLEVASYPQYFTHWMPLPEPPKGE